MFSGQNFDVHFNSNHHSIKTKKKSTLHTCSHCTKSFPSAHYLKFHENSVHIKSNNVKCQICNKSFTGDYYLRQHIKRDNTKLQILIINIPSFEKFFFMAHNVGSILRAGHIHTIQKFPYFGIQFGDL